MVLFRALIGLRLENMRSASTRWSPRHCEQCFHRATAGALTWTSYSNKLWDLIPTGLVRVRGEFYTFCSCVTFILDPPLANLLHRRSGHQ